jgi:hypothetical protein
MTIPPCSIPWLTKGFYARPLTTGGIEEIKTINQDAIIVREED